jgi:chemotaxis protein MotA
MDFSLIVGIIIGVAALLTGYALEHGVISSLFLISPFIIVFGGTVGCVIASFSFNDIAMAMRAMMKSFNHPHSGSMERIISKISMIATRYRANGVTCLEEISRDPELNQEEYLLLKEGLVLIQELKTPEDIQYTLESDIRAYVQQRSIEASVFESAAGFSPTMGVIGTVMGLIMVLAAGFDDPSKLAGSIATAFIATLYGVFLANIIYLPIATKLKTQLKRKHIQKEMIVDGVCMIARGSTSRNIENELALYFQAFSDGGKRYKQGIEN